VNVHGNVYGSGGIKELARQIKEAIRKDDERGANS
jgi:hypothetical protein